MPTLENTKNTKAMKPTMISRIMSGSTYVFTLSELHFERSSELIKYKLKKVKK